MSDPRITAPFEMTEAGPKARSANLSRLMKAKSKGGDGRAINFCPFGCTDQQLDAAGYCRHLIGFTNDKKTYEPMIRRKGGQRAVRVHREQVQIGVDPEDGSKVFEEGPPQLPAVRESDKLERITTSYRVYRDVDRCEPDPAVPAKPKGPTADELRAKAQQLLKDAEAAELAEIADGVEALTAAEKA